MTVNECAWCGKPFQRAKKAPIHLYDSQRCRQAAWRRRRWLRQVEQLMETTCAARSLHARAGVDELPELDLMLLLV